MRIGFVGLGKMGLPIAVAMSMRGHDVMGTDLDKSRMTTSPQPYQETGPDGTGNFNDYLERSVIRFGNLDDVIVFAEIVFVAVQTPHQEKYEGITRIPSERVDFDYTYLKSVMSQINAAASNDIIVVIMSTVLPGTIRREIMPIVSSHIRIVYNPSFIAMGTTMRDFLEPEFILMGSDDDWARLKVSQFYERFETPQRCMSIESAELTKVSYNTYLSLKIAFANTVMEMCDAFGPADCDDVTGTLKLSNRRIVSSLYMDGGMGDGGGCHPRDNIALSWLARDIGLSFDLFDAAMKCRENQADFLATMLYAEHLKTHLPIFILGVSFKPETNLTVGSPALLVVQLLKERGIEPFMIDDSVETELRESTVATLSGVYLIGCRHARYETFTFGDGSVVIDPHRYVRVTEDVKYTVRRIGEGV